MNTKFKQGETALLGTKKVVIKVAQKNFSNGKIRYLLDEGGMVEEDRLSKVAKKKVTPADEELEAARKEYKAVFGKEVAASKKNDKDWMLKKIEEEKAAIEEEKKLAALRQEYLDLGNETPGEDEWNDAEWLANEIESQKAAQTDEDDDEEKTPWEILQAVEDDNLPTLIADKGLEIDPEDFAEAGELRKAIAQELKIEIPEEE